MNRVLPTRVKGYTMILLASVMFGSYGIWSKIMGDQFEVFYQGWVRSAIVIALLLPLIIYQGLWRTKIARSDIKWLTVFLGFTIFTQAPLYYAFVVTSVGTATLLFYATFIIASFLVGRFIIGEKITRVKLLAMLLAFVGLVLVFGFSLAKFSVIGMAMAAINGVASGGEVSSSKKLSEKYPTLLLTFYSWVILLVTHLIASLVMGETQWAIANTAEWWAMLAYSGVGLASFWLVIEGFKYVDASIGSLVGLLEIVWAVIFGALLFGEQITPTIIIGGCIILVAGYLPDIKDLLSKRRSKQPVELPREM